MADGEGGPSTSTAAGSSSTLTKSSSLPRKNPSNGSNGTASSSASKTAGPSNRAPLHSSSSSATSGQQGPVGQVGKFKTPGPPTGKNGSKVAQVSSDKPVFQVQPGSRLKNAIVVSNRQRGNPILAEIRNVGWEYGDIVPDYVVGAHTCVLFLSLKYHRLHPEYLHQRVEKLSGMYQVRLLLLMCDVNDHQDPIREITKICIINELTIVMAWTPEEAGNYLSKYKEYEHKPPDTLKERVDDSYRSRIKNALTSVKGINKTDVTTLTTNFGSFKRMVLATPEEISLCPGLGDIKVRRLTEAFNQPFVQRGAKALQTQHDVDISSKIAEHRANLSHETEMMDMDEEFPEIDPSGIIGQNNIFKSIEKIIVRDDQMDEDEDGTVGGHGDKQVRRLSPDWPSEIGDED